MRLVVNALIAAWWASVLASTTLAAKEDLEISEFLASNKAGLKDEDGDYSDWIELHNGGSTPVDLAGMSLTDDATIPTKFTFPSVTLAAGEYLLVFASSKDRADPTSELHTTFALGAGGEYLGLYDADGSTVLQEYAPEYPPQSDDISYGINNNNQLRFFSNPSPGQANGVGDLPVAGSVTADVDRGFYSSTFSVHLSSPQSNAQIRYTTNGSEPAQNSGNVYSGSITISTTTVLRAAAFLSGYQDSPVSTYSYVFLEDVIDQPATIPGFPNGVTRSTGGGSAVLDMAMDPSIVNEYSNEILDSMTAIPTMSITADLDDIFGGSGFYFGSDVERKVSMEILSPSGNEQIDVGAQGHSHDRLKRSLRLNFRTEYGNREWKTSFFQDNAPLNADSFTDKHRTLVLRAGNNRSWARSWNPDKTAYTIDELYRSSYVAMTGGGSRGTFVHLYLNGVYWGVYNVVERPDEQFASEYYGGDDDDWFFTNHGG